MGNVEGMAGEVLADASSTAPNEFDIQHATAASENSEDRRAGPMSATLGTRRDAFQLRVGQVVLAMLRLRRYQGLSISDLRDLVIEPLLADRIAIAEMDDDREKSPVGMAIWASVSQTTHERIAKQVEEGAFPIRLDKGEWNSGEQVWLLDILVPDRNAGTAVLINFAALIGDRSFRMHPSIAITVDPNIADQLKKLRRPEGS